MKTFSVDDVADTLISLANAEGIPVSNLKLQKLMYYAQAWNLVFENKPLFNEDFEAWVHGPVVPKLFRRFKESGWSPIEGEISPLDDEELRQFLMKIIKAYGSYGATQLEELTHTEEPWKEARGGIAPNVSSHAVISKESMKIYYARKINVGKNKA